MNALSFWAQALNNSSPDHIVKHGVELEPDDILGRREVVSLVSEVIKRGTRIYESKGSLLTADAHHFVIEIPTAQLDQIGRTAPIVCYGCYNKTMDEEFKTKVIGGLETFAAKIGRSVQSEQIDFIHESFTILKKKSTKKIIRTAIIVLAVLLGFLYLGHWKILQP